MGGYMQKQKSKDNNPNKPFLITIYHRPIDYPNTEYVARAFSAKGKPLNIVGEFNTLDYARKYAQTLGCDTRFPRHRVDDPKIVESWL